MIVLMEEVALGQPHLPPSFLELQLSKLPVSLFALPLLPWPWITIVIFTFLAAISAFLRAAMTGFGLGASFAEGTTVYTVFPLFETITWD